MKKLLLTIALMAFSTVSLHAITVVNNTSAAVWVRWGYDQSNPTCSYRAFQIPAMGSFTETTTPSCGANFILLNNTLPQGPVDYKWKYSVSTDTLVVDSAKDKMYRPILTVNGVAGVAP